VSALVTRHLCIPATPAPSEHVFSTASVMIAKDCERLASEMANELIFLHEALPAIRNFYEAGRHQG
jgi:hypothetical protein